MQVVYHRVTWLFGRLVRGQFVLMLAVMLVTSVCLEGRAQEFNYGLIMDDQSYLRLPIKPPVLTKRGLRNLPSAVMYENYCPRPASQERQGTCMAFALGYYLRTVIEAKRQHLTDRNRITELAFSPTFLYEEAKLPNDYDCSQGLNVDAAIEVIRQRGIVPLKTLGYPACGQTTVKLRAQAQANRIAEAQRIFGLTDSPEERISHLKTALTEGLPVVVSFLVVPSFGNLKASLWEPTANETNAVKSKMAGVLARQTTLRGHALCVLGYDNSKFGGAFRIVNSRGEDWADGGFCWIRYADLAAFTRYGVQVYPQLETADRKAIGGLQAELSFEQQKGGSMPAQFDAATSQRTGILTYRMSQSYSTGTSFKFSISNDRQAYLYVFGTDNSPNAPLDKLYPYTETNAGQTTEFSPLLGASTTISYPPSNYIELDSTAGTDYLVLLLANRPQDQSQLARRWVSARNASRPAQLQQLIPATEVIAPAQVHYETDRIRFTVRPDATGSVLLVLVLIDHR
ncbi:C1 family peptidase [Spirosoma fluviale]|uniref:Papain family cysteine protease n=1 Tax=Spirosoma fluviale TaxID=1597977 RepID=A0A286GW36_9BACT|nr:C1 family peptidase [Spirosoma fluviale]SOD99702.1 Papain family cysteine protease [Spirosoma fluviale]